MPVNIKRGDSVEFRDAFGVWHRGVATSDIEPTHIDGRRVHDFPVIFVSEEGSDASVPWPVEDVRNA